MSVKPFEPLPNEPLPPKKDNFQFNDKDQSTISERAGSVAKRLYHMPLIIVVGSISYATCAIGTAISVCVAWAIGTAMSVVLFSLARLIHIPTFIVSVILTSIFQNSPRTV
jgi:hypothetical protein